MHRTGTTLAIALLAVALGPHPAHATFHLMQITKVLAGFEGDTRIQAVELTMIFDGQNLVDGVSLRSYDTAGNLIRTLGTFNANVANGFSGSRILCATRNFETAFGVDADLLISSDIPVMEGQVAFENAICLVNAVGYGNVSVLKNGPTPAPFLPASGATALVRIGGNGTFPSCPLGENAGLKFALRSGSQAAPITFTNNAGQTAQVFTTASSVEEGSPTAAPRVRVAPNPAPGRVSMTATTAGGGRMRVFSAQGRLAWESPVVPAGVRTVTWDGMLPGGAPAPSGVYILVLDSGGATRQSRFLLIR